MKLRNKKGFTIIELVIVIAVIGVLTAVLVPTFTNLLSKANKASDDSLVSALNKALQAEEAYEGKKNDTYHDAMLDLEKNGFILPNLQTKSGEVLLWDKANNKFLYESELPTQNNNLNYWKIQNDLSEQKYSVYAGNNFDESAIEHLKVGFDAGRKNIPSIHYEGNGSSAQEVVIRTNSSSTSLSVNAPQDTINHFGYAGGVDIIAVANKSYHENGNVAFLEIAKGRVALEADSNVKQIHVSTKITNVAEDGTKTKEANTFDQVIIALASGVEVPDFSRDEVALNSIGSDGKLVVEIEKENNQSDYVYLYQQGLVEQIRVSSGDSTNSGTSVQPAAISEQSKKGSDESLSSNTSSIAIDIANNLKAGSTATPEQIAAGTVDLDQIVEAGLNEEAKETAKETAVNDAMVEEYSSSGDKAIPENAVAYNVNSQTYYSVGDDYETGMAALRQAFDAAQSKDVVLLMNDVTLTLGESQRFSISKSVTINGNNHTVTTDGLGFGVGLNATSKVDVTFKNITIINTASGGRCIDTRGNLNSLTLDNVALKTTNTSGYLQPLTIGGTQSEIAPVTIKNSLIETSDDGRLGYAIIAFNPVDMYIADSTIKGWACIYAKAGTSGSNFTIDNSHLISKNIYSGNSNAFAIIKMEEAGVNVNSIMRGCTFDINGVNNYQYIVSFRSSEQTPVAGCVVAIGPGNIINLYGDATFDNGTENGSVLYITGGTFNKNPTGHLVDGYVAHDNGDGTWTVVRANYKVNYQVSDIGTLYTDDEDEALAIEEELEGLGYQVTTESSESYLALVKSSQTNNQWALGAEPCSTEEEAQNALVPFINYGWDTKVEHTLLITIDYDGFADAEAYFETEAEADAFVSENGGTKVAL